LLREGYYTGNIGLPYTIFRKLCILSKLKESNVMRFVKEIKKPNWGQVIGGKIGGSKHKTIIKVKINHPKVSEDLGEFIGIILGDGSIDYKNYTVQICLHRQFDSEYSKYVTNLVRRLFGVESKVYNNSKENMTVIRINSKLLVEFLERFKLRKKQIPKIFSENNKLLSGVLRGLFDTDGSIHMSSKWCVLDFTSNSILLKDFKNHMENFDIPCFITSNHVNITSLWKIKRFMEVIGSSNVKNIIKFQEYTKNKISLKNKDTLKLLSKYKEMKLPYRLGL
jgi:hypothetical protein